MARIRKCMTLSDEAVEAFSTLEHHADEIPAALSIIERETSGRVQEIAGLVLCGYFDLIDLFLGSRQVEAVRRAGEGLLDLLTHHLPPHELDIALTLLSDAGGRDLARLLERKIIGLRSNR